MKATKRYETHHNHRKTTKDKPNKKTVIRENTLKTFCSKEPIYALFFYGFILICTVLFIHKQNEPVIKQSLGVVESVTEYSRAQGIMLITTDRSKFFSPRQVGLIVGDNVILEKLYSGKNTLCVTRKKNCVEISKTFFLSIRPLR